MSQNEENDDTKKLRVAPDVIKLSNTVKFFEKPLRPIKPLKLLEESEISERLRQRNKSARS